MAALAEGITLTCPCEPRFVTVVKDAVATAVRSSGGDPGRADRTASAVAAFLETCLAEAPRAPIDVRISDRTVRVAVASHTLDLDL
jgi:hypothetical protein